MCDKLTGYGSWLAFSAAFHSKEKMMHKAMIFTLGTIFFAATVAASIGVFFYSTSPDAAKRALAAADAKFETDRQRKEVATIERLQIEADVANQYYAVVRNSLKSIEIDIVEVANKAAKLDENQGELDEITGQLASRYLNLGVSLGHSSESAQELVHKLQDLRIKQLQASRVVSKRLIAANSALAQANLTAVQDNVGPAALARLLRSTDGASEALGITVKDDPATEATIQSMQNDALRTLAITIAILTTIFLGFVIKFRFFWNTERVLPVA